jgi:hypothetical protein
MFLLIHTTKVHTALMAKQICHPYCTTLLRKKVKKQTNESNDGSHSYLEIQMEFPYKHTKQPHIKTRDLHGKQYKNLPPSLVRP